MKLAYRSEKNAEAAARYWGKSLDKPDWYRIEAKETDETAEIIIYDVIGWPYNDAFDLVRGLGNIKAKNITVRINSPGGDVFDGLAIFNALKDHSGKVTTRIEGLAASMASIIALSGDEVQAHKNTMFMIHNPFILVCGDDDDLHDAANIVTKVKNNMIDIYADEGNVGKRELKSLMKAQTWWTAQEAKDRGFVDTVLEAGAAKARFDLSIFANVPDDYEPPERTEREKEKALRDVGLSIKEAKAFLAGRREAAQRDVEEQSQILINAIKKLKGER